MIPRLTTPRLLLREPRLDDFERFATDAADAMAHEQTGGPIDRREAWRRFHAAAGHWILEGIGWWTIEERSRGAIGMIGLFHRETGPEVEIGWTIHRANWNRGFASEAARAALDFAVTTVGIPRVIANIAKGHEASMKVATNAGMRLEGDVDFYGEWLWRFALVAP
jgi:RimJ/RimL family protein N-acetyltransferase